MTPERIREIAHRHAWRYKKSSDPNDSDTYTFNGCTLENFARALEREVRAAAPSGVIVPRAIVEAVHRELDEADGSGNAPGHAHEVPGIWDSDNGEKAGKPCAWCATWAAFTKLLAASPSEGSAGDAPRALTDEELADCGLLSEIEVATPVSPAGTAVPGMTQEKN